MSCITYQDICLYVDDLTAMSKFILW